MSTIRLFTIAVALSLLASPKGHAADQAAPDPVFEQPASGAASISEINERMARASVIRARFVQTKKIAALTRPLVSEGTMLFARGMGVVWSVERPVPSTFVVTPGRILRREEGRREVVVSAADRPEVRFFSEIFLSLFSGDLTALERKFAVHFTPAGEGPWKIGLRARDRSLERYLSSIVIEGREHLENVRIGEGGGDTSEIAFSDVTVSTAEPGEAERAAFD